MKVSCLNKISQIGLNTFTSKYQVIEDVNQAEIILVRSASMHEFEISDSLLAVARAGAGVNNIPLDKMAEAGVVVFNTPGANANGVKELVLAGMLMSARDLIGGIDWVRNNKHDQDILKTIEKAKSAFAGTEILGKTILVVGLGAIGGKVANACDDLGLKVIGYDPYLSDEAKALLNTSIEINNVLEDTYPIADYISLHLPLLDSTKNMINSEVISKFKPGVVLLNFSRDQLVKNEDLKDALDSRIIKKYVTDFPNHYVANLEHVIAFPHLGASTEESEDNCAIIGAKQLMAYTEKGEIINSVNYPNVHLDSLNAKYRLIILTTNCSQTIEKIAQVFYGKESVINSKTSKLNQNYGFHSYDLDTDNINDFVNRINSIEGVYRVRVLEK